MDDTRPQDIAAVQARLENIRAQERDLQRMRFADECWLGRLIVGVEIGQRITWPGNVKTGTRFEGVVTDVRPDHLNKSTFTEPGDFEILADGQFIKPDGTVSLIPPQSCRRLGDKPFTILTPEPA